MSERADFQASRSGAEGRTQRPAPQYGVRAPGHWTPPAALQPPVPPAPRPAARENVLRGALFATAAFPVGVIAWMFLWDLGWMASVVAFLASVAAARLYVVGTRGMISRRGAWVIGAVTVVTLLLSFLGSMLLDMAKFIGGASPVAMLAEAQTWELLGYNLTTNRGLVDTYAGDFLLAVVLSALGCFFTLRQLFAQARRD